MQKRTASSAMSDRKQGSSLKWLVLMHAKGTHVIVLQNTEFRN